MVPGCAGLEVHSDLPAVPFCQFVLGYKLRNISRRFLNKKKNMTSFARMRHASQEVSQEVILIEQIRVEMRVTFALATCISYNLKLALLM